MGGTAGKPVAVSIADGYESRVRTPSDINEHLGTLRELAAQCSHVTEAGVRGAISSYAFALGLLGREHNTLVQIDPQDSKDAQNFRAQAAKEGLDVVFYNQSDLTCPVELTDMLFLDTWHVYAQLKRELARWCDAVNTYIVLHDTTVDAEIGETVRRRWNIEAQAADSGFPVNEITRGLWPAVTEFLRAHPEWALQARHMHNNGLTILKRIA